MLQIDPGFSLLTRLENQFRIQHSRLDHPPTFRAVSSQDPPNLSLRLKRRS
jgi:hypothetical protein